MSATIHILNLPLDSTIYQINTELCKIGDIKRSYLVKDGELEIKLAFPCTPPSHTSLTDYARRYCLSI